MTGERLSNLRGRIVQCQANVLPVEFFLGEQPLMKSRAFYNSLSSKAKKSGIRRFFLLDFYSCPNNLVCTLFLAPCSLLHITFLFRVQTIFASLKEDYLILNVHIQSMMSNCLCLWKKKVIYSTAFIKSVFTLTYNIRLNTC